MKRFFTTIFLIALIISGTRAQSIIRGIVLDSEKNPIGYANITLGNKTGTISDDNGKFKFENLKVGNYKVCASYLGYEEYCENVTLNNYDTINLIIKLKPLDLYKDPKYPILIFFL